MELCELERRILERIKPREEEYEVVRNAFHRIKEALEESLRRHGVKADITLQGSIAHDTWLSGDRDLDVFVLFPSDWSREDLEKKALPILIEAASGIGVYELRYAEHPYVRVRFNGVEADIVAGLKLDRPDLAKTAVDRTPFHTLFLEKALTPELRDHVRLLKKFMKSIGVYGAEVKVRGFSGYAVELLIVAYGGFREVLREASEWRPPVIVNTIGEKLTRDLIKELKAKYPDSIIYMPDPVDYKRNVTASVNAKSLFTFIIASRCYLRNPSTVFFEEPRELSLEELINAVRDRCMVFLIYELRESLPPDVIWGEAWRVASTAQRVLSTHDLRVIDYSAWSNDRDTVVIALELENCQLPRFKHYIGPCLPHEEDRVVSFLRKHLGRRVGPWINNEGCLESIDERRLIDAVEIISEKWSEFTVSPHLKTIKPLVTTPTLETLKYFVSIGAGLWVRDFILKTPIWMEKCIF